MDGYGAMSSCHCTCKSHDLDHVVHLDVVAEDLLLFTGELKLRPPSRNTHKMMSVRTLKLLRYPLLQSTALSLMNSSETNASWSSPALTGADRKGAVLHQVKHVVDVVMQPGETGENRTVGRLTRTMW